jgi:hypothetical protein
VEAEKEKSLREVNIEATKIWAETTRYQTDRIVEAFNVLVNAVKNYYIRGRKLLTLSAFMLIATIFCVMAFLTFIGRVGGETFAFVTGTIVGYIISLLAGK